MMNGAISMEENYDSDGMLDMYLYENFQLLEQMEAIMLSDETDASLDKDDIDEIFRIMHTIKGSSGIMMYDNITMAAHKLEDIFYYLRETFAKRIAKKELSQYVFMVSDFISGELNKIKEGKNADGDSGQIEKSIDEYIERWKEQRKKSGDELPPENLYIEPNQYYIAPTLEGQEKLPLTIDLGEIPEAEPGNYVIGGMIGVSEKKLNRLTGVVEKFLKLENSINEESDLHDIKKKLSRLTTQLEGVVADIRKTTIADTLKKMRRLIFDIAGKQDKEIELVLFGETVELDRSVAEGVADPLMHIVRNAADHGIEKKDVRKKAGKPERGKIIISVKKAEDAIAISVQDDGGGIDKKKVFEKAKCQGITKKKSIGECTEEELYHLITYPGFTTKETATEYSGRGVGLDVVADRMREMGGSLQIESRLGEGTKITLMLPAI